MQIVDPSVKLKWITPNAEEVIYDISRICYQSEPSRPAGEFIKKILLDKKHDAMLEHASASLIFVCDRGVSHEMVRHRMASFAQESTRFVKYDNIQIIQPPDINNLTFETWETLMLQAERAYKEILSAGHPAQIARAVLPTCLKTQIAVTANLREWRHIIRLRLLGTTGKPHPQIKQVIEKALQILFEQCPNVFEDLMVQAVLNEGSAK